MALDTLQGAFRFFEAIMGKRKTAQDLALGGASRSKIARRKAETAGVYALGCPLMPQGKEKNWRRTWGIVSAELLASRKLALSDANLLASLVDALRGSRLGTTEERAAAHAEALRIRGEFDARTPFVEVKEEPKAEVQHALLSEYIAQVKECRASFQARLVPDQTVTLDENGTPYDWREGDAAEIARRYAMQIAQGDIVAGKLVQCAAKRFLQDLEVGHLRGLFFDPLEARLIKTWFDEFGAWKILDWQIFLVVQLFAWKKAAGTRRFSRLWLAVARKNGKSAMLSAIGLFCLVADGTDRAEVYSAATKRDQARIIWADADDCVRKNAQLADYVNARAYALAVKETGSTFQYLGSDANTLDGLRPSCCLIDEIHAHSNDAVVKRLQSGTLSRPQPLLLFATTAGEDRDTSWCYSQHEIFERLLLGTTEEHAFSDSWLLYIAQMDEEDQIEDETCWLKSNPSLGVTLTYDSLRIEAAALKEDPACRFSFIRFHANVWNSVVLGYSLPQDKIAACIGADMPEGGAMELRKQVLAKLKEEKTLCFGGFDLGLSDDIAAFVIMSDRYKTGKLTDTGAYIYKTAVVPWFFIPAARVLEHEKLWRVPLSQWIREGFVTIAGEELVDLDIIEKVIKQVCSEYRCPVIGFDKWKSEIFFSKLHAQKVAHCVAVPQMPSFLTAPSRELKMSVLNGTLAHFGNPVYQWMLSNVDLEPDERHGGIRPTKSGGDRRKKIDGVQATVSAWQQLLDPENMKYTRIPRIFPL